MVLTLNKVSSLKVGAIIGVTSHLLVALSVLFGAAYTMLVHVKAKEQL